MQLFPQAAKTAFGPILTSEFERPDCKQADIAVAWVRATGLLHMQDGFEKLIQRGGKITVVAGIDYDNTSEEGLQGLLDIAATANGRMRVFVRHNEAGPVFHPKLYCFRDTKQIRVYIGSNNLTQAGLFQNEELSVLISANVGEQLQKDVDGFIGGLVDQSTGLTHQLTPAFLVKLVSRGYVRKELLLRTTWRARARSQRKQTALFAAVSVRPPKRSTSATSVVQPVATDPGPLTVREDWHAVYLRLRLARGTQAQIPIKVVREIRRRMGLTPLDGALTIKSRADGSSHGINPAKARGGINTYKFEASIVKNEPLLRIYPVGQELFFEILDSADSLGKPVMQLLQHGFKTDPPQTFATGGKQATATWYRFE
jgi:HKD family nuclease